MPDMLLAFAASLSIGHAEPGRRLGEIDCRRAEAASYHCRFAGDDGAARPLLGRLVGPRGFQPPAEIHRDVMRVAEGQTDDEALLDAAGLALADGQNATLGGLRLILTAR